MERLLITVEEARQLTGVGRRTAYKLCKSGRWPSVRIGRSVKVHLGRLRQWADSEGEIEKSQETFETSSPE